jgi:hypothetical protein
MTVDRSYIMPPGHETQPSYADRPSNLQQFLTGVFVGGVLTLLLAKSDDKPKVTPGLPLAAFGLVPARRKKAKYVRMYGL